MPSRSIRGIERQCDLHTIEWGITLQRLFSTFPNSWPGVGLLLLRSCLGITLIYFAVADLAAKSLQPTALAQNLLAAAGGIFLLLACGRQSSEAWLL